ncbi:MAG: hypothetical protein ACLFVR_15680 [Thiohalospira sp.]
MENEKLDTQKVSSKDNEITKESLKPNVYRYSNIKLVIFENDNGISSYKFEKFYKQKETDEYKTTNYINEADLYKVRVLIDFYLNKSVKKQ